MLNYFCKILQHPKINPGSAPDCAKNEVKDFFSKYDQICMKLKTWLHLLKEFLMEDDSVKCKIKSMLSQLEKERVDLRISDRFEAR